MLRPTDHTEVENKTGPVLTALCGCRSSLEPAGTPASREQAATFGLQGLYLQGCFRVSGYTNHLYRGIYPNFPLPNTSTRILLLLPAPVTVSHFFPLNTTAALTKRRASLQYYWYKIRANFLKSQAQLLQFLSNT